jgi:hypothetical protein
MPISRTDPFQIYDALKDKPTGTYGLGTFLKGEINRLIPKGLEGATAYAVDLYTDVLTPLDFQYHLGKMHFSGGSKKPALNCVSFSFWIRGDLPTMSKKLKAGAEWEGSTSGQIHIIDCCSYKLEDIDFSGRIYLNGKLGLAAGIAPANIGINARTATSFWLSRSMTDKEQELKLNMDFDIRGGIQGQLGNGTATYDAIEFNRQGSIPIPIPQ